MCQHISPIVNNSNHYNVYKPLYFYVNCGKCEECLHTRRNDWFIRAYYQYNSTKRYSGRVYMFTLTFNNSNLPIFNGRVCFDNRIFQKFIKRLRSYFNDHYPSYSFTYLACPEFGETYGRPHYHLLLYVTASDFNLRNFFVYESVLACWQQGFIHVRKGSNLGEIMHLKALRYTTKYVTKNVHGYSHRLFWFRYSLIRKHYKQFLLQNDYVSLREIASSLFKCVTNSLYADAYRDYADEVNILIPKVHASLGFGSCALDYLSKSNIDSETVLAPAGDSYVNYSMPLYIKRKLFYDRLPNERDGKLTRYVLSLTGVEHKMDKLASDIRRTELDLRSYLLPQITEYEFNQISKKLQQSFPYAFTCASDVNTYIDSVLDYNLTNVAIYCNVYRGSILTTDYRGLDLFDKSVYTSFYHRRITPTDYHCDGSFIERSKSSQLAIMRAYGETQQLFELEHDIITLYEILKTYKMSLISIARQQSDERKFKVNELLKLF